MLSLAGVPADVGFAIPQPETADPATHAISGAQRTHDAVEENIDQEVSVLSEIQSLHQVLGQISLVRVSIGSMDSRFTWVTPSSPSPDWVKYLFQNIGDKVPM